MRRIILLLLCCLVLICPVFAESSVPQVQTSATVTTDSRCSVTMTATLNLEENVRGVSVLLPEDAEAVTLNGTVMKPRQNRIRLDDITGGLAGAYSVTITYQIPNAISQADDALTLVVPLLAGFAYPVERMSFTVTLPGIIDYRPTFSSGYYQERIESSLSYAVKSNTVSGVIATPLKDHETLSMFLTVSEEMFPQKKPLPSTLAFDQAGLIVCAGLAFLFWVLTMYAAPIFRVRETMPPAGLSAGELGSRLVLAPTDLTMMVLTWAQLGYLMIQSDDSGRVILYKKLEMGNERSAFEIRWFQALFYRRNRENASGLRYARLCQQAASTRPATRELFRPTSGNPILLRLLTSLSAVFAGFGIGDSLTEHFLLRPALMVALGILAGIAAWRIQKGAYYLQLRKGVPFWAALVYSVLFLILGLVSGQLSLALAAVVLAWLAGLAAAYSGKRTELGRQLASEILGLRYQLAHIPSQELNRILQSNPNYFYSMVPFAMALGVDRRFAKRMGSGHLPPCGWFVTSLDTPRSAEEWCKLLRQAVSRMDRSDPRPLWQRILRG